MVQIVSENPRQTYTFLQATIGAKYFWSSIRILILEQFTRLDVLDVYFELKLHLSFETVSEYMKLQKDLGPIVQLHSRLVRISMDMYIHMQYAYFVHSVLQGDAVWWINKK